MDDNYQSNPGQPQKPPLEREPWMDLHPQITPEQWLDYYNRMTAQEWAEYCRTWREEYQRVTMPSYVPAGPMLYGYGVQQPYSPPVYAPPRKKRGLWHALWPVVAFFLGLQGAGVLLAVIAVIVLVVQIVASGQIPDEVEITQRVYEFIGQAAVPLQTILEMAMIPFCIILLRRDAKQTAMQPFTRRSVGLTALLIPIIFAACLVISIALSWLSAQMPDVMSQYEEIINQMLTGPGWLTTISMVFVAPVIEELVMRGLVMRRLRFVMSDALSILVSALLFGLIHMNLVQGTYAFLLGVLIGWLYVRTDNLVIPILAHVLFNALGSGLLGWLIEAIGTLIGYDLLTAFENLPEIPVTLISLLIILAFAMPYAWMTKKTAKLDRSDR